jgi:hypothetical protein
MTNKTSNVDAALRYAEHGYRVLAVWPLAKNGCACAKGKLCKTPGKHPMQSAWQKSATTDAAEIKRIWGRHPDAHIGIMPRKGDVIIDVDPRNGGHQSLKELLGKSKLPNTVVQRSGGKGLHIFGTGECSGFDAKKHPGIDVKRYERGFVVAWPSKHHSGGEYQWREGCAPWEIEPAPLPACLSGDTRTASELDAAGEEPPGLYIGDVPPLVSIDTMREALACLNADDYHRWVNVGQALKHAYGDDGLELWEQWSQTSSSYNDGDCDKWHTFDQNRDRPLLTIRSVLAMAKREGYRPLATEFSQTLWATGDISGYTSSVPEPLDWVAEPNLARGKVTVLSGAGGSSKSFLSLMLTLFLAMAKTSARSR